MERGDFETLQQKVFSILYNIYIITFNIHLQLLINAKYSKTLKNNCTTS